MKRQSKKEKEIIEKFKRDTEGMISSQIFEYNRLSDLEKDVFVKKFRDGHDIRHVSHENHIKKIERQECKIHDDKSSLTKKEREKGFRAERIWIEGNSEISNESVKSNNLRSAGQFFEREYFFKIRDFIENKKKELKNLGKNDEDIKKLIKQFYPSKKERYIRYGDLDKFKDKTEILVDENGKEDDKYRIFKDAYLSMSMACLSQQTLTLVDDSWDGYYEGLFGFLRGDPNYTGIPNIP